jgi:hypothetical protein
VAEADEVLDAEALQQLLGGSGFNAKAAPTTGGGWAGSSFWKYKSAAAAIARLSGGSTAAAKKAPAASSKSRYGAAIWLLACWSWVSPTMRDHSSSNWLKMPGLATPCVAGTALHGCCWCSWRSAPHYVMSTFTHRYHGGLLHAASSYQLACCCLPCVLCRFNQHCMDFMNLLEQLLEQGVVCVAVGHLTHRDAAAAAAAAAVIYNTLQVWPAAHRL